MLLVDTSVDAFVYRVYFTCREKLTNIGFNSGRILLFHGSRGALCSSTVVMKFVRDFGSLKGVSL